MKISDTHFFKTTSPILPTRPFLWEEKSEPPFSKISKTLQRMRGRFQLCFSFSKLTFTD